MFKHVLFCRFYIVNCRKHLTI